MLLVLRLEQGLLEERFTKRTHCAKIWDLKVWTANLFALIVVTKKIFIHTNTCYSVCWFNSCPCEGIYVETPLMNYIAAF